MCALWERHKLYHFRPNLHLPQPHSTAATCMNPPTTLSCSVVIRVIAPIMPSNVLLRALAWAWHAPLALTMFYLVMAPYTKVEESFNMQAAHDLLYYGTDITQYDHHMFPGVVPRTFVGPVTLAAFAKPIVYLVGLVVPRCDHLVGLYVVRGLLGVGVYLGFEAFRRAVQAQYGRPAAACLTALTCCQFHLLFYASRALPNTFALFCVYMALALWLNRRVKACLTMFTFAIVVFRFDVAVLLAPALLVMLVRREVGFFTAAGLGIVATAAFLGLSVGVDSVFWRRWLWPEGEVLYYNTVLNKSSNWGTSPVHWYFTSALPRALLAAYPMFFCAFWAEPKFRPYSAAALVMVGLYSFLPHKELRFIFYALPLFNAHVAIALARWTAVRSKSAVRRLWWLGCILGLCASALCCGVFFTASINNYPAGDALRALHSMQANSTEAHSVHIDVLSSMNGITRFQKNYCRSLWRYSKDPSFLGAEHVALPPYTHLITSAPQNHTQHYAVAATVQQFARFSLRPPFLNKRDSVFVMRRRPQVAAAEGHD